ncbi:Arginine transport ATP-binding protein ArtM [Oligella urethralis]|uniref:phosphonate ABC transporter ATP-binding protein n=1 Tax=Oligella urethralis TaxID=90245 RepID=UPI000CFEC385|nr:phosphonate ABC transporter ATP-binding protein [Oligella urethralis]AVL70300.1 phosphonate ABC transporter ATP-binding protein [Oligella urethralis]WOS36913.1 Arginine transport ATP-binding protein ArtM [Oligella urethralis]
MLKLVDLEKRYNTNEPVLKGINLEAQSGEVIGLIGPSGAGKSTLIRCVNRLVEPSNGAILLQGNDLNKLSKKQLRHERRRIGMIFQEYALIERLTVMENVLSGRLGQMGFWNSWFRRFNPEDISEAYELLDRVGLKGKENNRADELSGGQRQRVGIARALIQRPDLLLIDEPTASLDPKTSRQIMRLIIELCRERGLAAIINIHDVVLASEFLPRIVGLRAGSVVFDGPAKALNDTVLSTIYGDEDWTAICKKIAAQSTVDSETEDSSTALKDAAVSAA